MLNIYNLINMKKQIVIGITFLILVIGLSGCIEETPVTEAQTETKQSFEGGIGSPLLLIDSHDNAIILFGQDTDNYSGYRFGDSEIDRLYFNKFNSNGDKIIENRTILISKAILNPIVFMVDDDHIYIVWLDPRNNPNFEGGYHPYYGDVYYKVIDGKGRTRMYDTKLTDELVTGYSSINLSELEGVMLNGTIGDLEKPLFLYNETIIDSENNSHHFQVTGSHITDSCQIIYSKTDSEGNMLINNKEIAKFEKLSESEWPEDVSPHWGSSLHYVIGDMDSQDNIHIVWWLNNGLNHFSVYYMKLNNKGETLVYEKLAED